MRILLFILLSISSLCAEDVYALFGVNANKDSMLNTTATGVIKKIYVDVGSVVSKGDLLLELDTDELQKSIAIDKANLNISQEELSFATAQLDRYSKVKQSIPAETIAKLEHDKNLRVANIDLIKANIAYKETQLSKCVIKAPFSGKIVQKNVDEGTLLSPATPAFKLIDNTAKLVIEFDDKYLPLVKVGSTYRYKLASSQKELITKIEKIYPFVDTKTKRAKAEAITTEARVGQFGDGYIQVEQ